ncbi:hypothetical protein [Hymenobacter persicinus]|uniref:DUF4294 domain-containing protein n=1 Tax=Hymenobacter persicinus TaxID=2025506 RepID=A0A4Q5LCP3_9BACT|nr:hypothetical protein [Hymenobacter persicinus]RYU77965.1 hypothetical protein EWM57_15860 [Hymenobacter persicinus]
MTKLFYALPLAVLSLGARAQAPTPAADTTFCVIDKTLSFGWGTLRFADGRAIQAYLPIPTQYPGIDYPFNYYFRLPNRKPTPPRQTAKVEDVLSMTAGPYYFETMRLVGTKKPKILAERVADGAVELFLQAEQQRAPLPIPVPGAMLHTAIPYTNSHFFIRRRGGALAEVDRGMFNAQVSQLLMGYPELAQKVARQEKDYHYRNLVAIITEYNAHLAAGPGSKP